MSPQMRSLPVYFSTILMVTDMLLSLRFSLNTAAMISKLLKTVTIENTMCVACYTSKHFTKPMKKVDHNNFTV